MRRRFIVGAISVASIAAISASILVLRTGTANVVPTETQAQTPAQAQVPNIVGLPLDEAKVALANVHLTLEVRHAIVGVVYKPFVAEQEVPPGTRVAMDSSVGVSIGPCHGPRFISSPNPEVIVNVDAACARS